MGYCSETAFFSLWMAQNPGVSSVRNMGLLFFRSRCIDKMHCGNSKVLIFLYASHSTAQLCWGGGASRSQLHGQCGDGICSSGEWK